MAGKDKDYTLGKGKVYFEQFAAGETTGNGEKYLSQTTAFSYNVAATVLDHYDADQGLKELDDEVTTQVDIKGKFDTDDISLDKIALFLLADGITETVVTSATALVSTYPSVTPDTYLQAGKSVDQPTGARNITVTKVATVAAPTVALVLNTDYTVDGAAGVVFMKDTTVAIAADGTDGIIITYNVAASTRQQIISKDTQLRGALRFRATNPVGTKKDYYFPLVNLTPNGDYNLKGDTWQTMGFNFTTLKLGVGERVYVDGVPQT